MEPLTHEMIALAHAWDRAMVANDVTAIARYVADDWIIVGPDGRVSDRATFFAPIASGDLTHDVMESHDIDVRGYGDTAVVVARGVSGGVYRGTRFLEHERVSSVFVRQDRGWRCVLTHLSRIADAGEPASSTSA